MNWSALTKLLSPLDEQIKGLPGRSRRLLLLLFALVVGGWVLVFGWFTTSTLSDNSAQIALRSKTLSQVRVYQKAYQQALVRIAQAEQRLASSAGQKPSSFIESKAKNHGIADKIQSINEQGSEPLGGLTETRYRVVIRRAPLRALVGFLHDIETSGFMVAESVGLKTTRVRNNKQLNLTLDLLTYSAKEGT